MNFLGEILKIIKENPGESAVGAGVLAVALWGTVEVTTQIDVPKEVTSSNTTQSSSSRNNKQAKRKTTLERKIEQYRAMLKDRRKEIAKDNKTGAPVSKTTKQGADQKTVVLMRKLIGNSAPNSGKGAGKGPGKAGPATGAGVPGKGLSAPGTGDLGPSISIGKTDPTGEGEAKKGEEAKSEDAKTADKKGEGEQSAEEEALAENAEGTGNGAGAGTGGTGGSGSGSGSGSGGSGAVVAGNAANEEGEGEGNEELASNTTTNSNQEAGLQPPSDGAPNGNSGPLPFVPQVSSISVENNKLIIEGISLNTVKNVKVTGPNAQEELFDIEAITSSKIVVKGQKAIALTINKIFNLILSDAHGAEAAFTLTVDLEEGSVEGRHLSDFGASPNDILKFNGAEWAPVPLLGGFNFLGSWDANTNVTSTNGAGPVLADGGVNTTPNNGDYYIVNVAGGTNIDGIGVWNVGDWIVFNATSGKWEQVQNSVEVANWNGRSGNVVPLEGDYNLDKLGDVDTTSVAPVIGQVLKWDGVNWVPDDDGSTSQSAEDIEITADSDGNATGGINFNVGGTRQATIQNDGSMSFNGDNPTTVVLERNSTGSGNNFTIQAGGAEAGANDQAGGNLILSSGTSTGNAESQIQFQTSQANSGGGSSDDNGPQIRMTIDGSGKVGIGLINPNELLTIQGVLSMQEQAASPGSTAGYGKVYSKTDGKLYFQNGAGVETDLTSVATAGDLKSDGSVPMTGNLDFGTNQAQFKDGDANYAKIQAPADITADYTLTLPIDDGSANQVLQTDGSGNLTWVNQDGTGGDLMADGSVPMTGDLDVGTNNTKYKDGDGNYANIKAPADVTADYTLTLPADDGSANQVLQTDGSGNLSWVNQFAGGDFQSDGSVVMTGDIDLGNNNAKFKSDNANYVNIKAADGLAANVNLTLPPDDGNANQILQTDGNGVLTWVNQDSGGDFQSDGSVAMTGNIDMGVNSTRYKDGDTNYVNLKAPAAITTDFTLTLPDNDGNANQVLQTDGSGNLSWVNQDGTGGDLMSDGSVAMTGELEVASVRGDTAASGTLTLKSTNNAAKGKILFGSSGYDEANNRLGLGTNAPAVSLEVADGGVRLSGGGFATCGKLATDASGNVTCGVDADSGGDIKSDGSVPMAADIDLGNNNAKFKSDNANYVNVKAPSGLAATVNLTLPSNDGDANQVLQTNGSGVMTWVDQDGTGGDLMSDGSVAMTGSLDLGNNSAKFKSDNANYVNMTAPNGLGATVNLTLPPTDGDANQVLQTDGSGVLTWVDQTGNGDFMADGSVPMTGELETASMRGGTAASGTLTLKSTTDATKGKILFGNSGYDEANNRLGVGTNAPAVSLEVADGAVRLSGGGFATCGKLATDASGNVTCAVDAAGGDFQSDGSVSMTGNLDVGNNDIILDDDDTNTVSIRGPADATANYVLTLPADDGNANQILQTDGSGGLSWVNQDSGGDFQSDGSVAMTGNIDMGTNSTRYKDGDTNYVNLKAPAAIASDFTLTLPDNDGDANQVLQTDGSGNLTWVDQTVDTDTNTTDHSALTNLNADDHTQYTMLAGRSGGQTQNGGTAASENLTLGSTSNATKGKILFGNSGYDEANNRLGVGTNAPAVSLEVADGAVRLSGGGFATCGKLATDASGNVTCAVDAAGGDFQSDGSVSMTGNLDVGNNDIILDDDDTNTVSIRGPADATANYVLTLPADDGNANQILQTDGSGGLSWVNQDSGGDFQSDGSVAMTGNLDVGNNDLRIKDDDTNYISLRGPSDATSDVVLILPDSDGDANQVLQTDGSGNLTWVDQTVDTDTNTTDHSALTNLNADDHTQYTMLAGRSGGQTQTGGTGASENLTLGSTSDATKGKILFGNSGYDEANNRLGVGTNAPAVSLEVADGAVRLSGGGFATCGKLATDASGNVTCAVDAAGGDFQSDGSVSMTGNLDVGNNDIVLDDDDTNTVSIRGPADATANYVLTLPADDGNANQILQTDGSGGLSWVNQDSGGDFQSDGSVAMTGNIDMGTNSTRYKDGDTNYVNLKAPAAITTDFTLTLPDNDGDANQVLQTDGSGNLTWVDQTTDTNTTDHSALTNLNADDHTQYTMLAGRSGGQTQNGGTAASENLTLGSTSNATKGKILFGNSGYDEANNRLGVGTNAPAVSLEVADGAVRLSGGGFATCGKLATDASGNVTCAVDAAGGDFQSDGSVSMTGNLDVGNNDIILDDDDTNTVSIRGPVDATANYILTLPADDGNANQILQTDGSGGLSWVDQSSNGDFMADGSVPMTGNIDMGTNSTRYKDGDTNYVNLKAPAAITTDFTLTLPDSDGDANQVLQTDGSGNLTWVDQTVDTDTNTTDHSALTNLNADDHTQYTMLAGRSGGQTQTGGTGASENLTLGSTSNATKGKILFGNSGYDEANNRLGVGTNAPAVSLEVADGAVRLSGGGFATCGKLATDASGNVTCAVDAAGGDFQSDGSVSMTGNLDVGNNDIILDDDDTNTVSIRGPADATANYVLTLPADDGNANQILQTDGSGGLSWVDQSSNGDFMADGSVPMTGNIDMGTNSTRYKDGDTNYVNLKAPAAITTDFTLTLPDSDGDANQVLQTDGSGNLTWVDQTTDTNTSDHGAMTGLTDDDHTQYTMLAGRSGGQTQNGGTDASDNLTLSSTTNATKGKILIGDSAYDEANNRLGIGTNAPDYKLHLVHTRTDTSGSVFGVDNNMTVAPSAVSTSAFRAGRDHITSNGAGANDLNNLTGHFGISKHEATGTITTSIGSQGSSRNQSTGTITNSYGIYGVSENMSTGPIGTSIAGRFESVNSGGGTTTNAYGNYSRSANTSTGNITQAISYLGIIENTGSGTISNGYGFRASLNATGPVTNYYGVYVEDEGVNANYYAVFTDGTTKSHFGGNVGMGTTTPGAQLEVRGTGIRATQICDEDGNNCKDISSGWSAASGDFMADGSVAMTGNLNLGGNYLSGDGDAEGVFVDNAGKVGVGTNTPNSNFNLVATKTDTSGNVHLSENTLNVGPGANSSATFSTLYNTVDSAGAGANDILQINGPYNRSIHNGTGELSFSYGTLNMSINNSTGSINQNYGVHGSARNFGGGSVTNAFGTYGEVYNSGNSSSTTTAKGLYSYVSNGANATITTAYGVSSKITNSVGTMTTAYGFRSELENTGTLTNYYGVYIDNVGVNANYYAIYTDGTTKSYFGGNVGIGVTAPGASLEVRGTGIRATQVCDEDGNNCKDISTGWGAGGDLMADGSVPMTGNLDMGANSTRYKDGDTNYVNLRAPAAITTDFTLTLPDSDGDANQVLQTDGSGNLTWVDQTTDTNTTDHGAMTGLTDDDHTQYTMLAGRSGGQTQNGGTDASDNLTLSSTTNATKGKILLGNSAYDETNNRLGLGTSSPGYQLDIDGTSTATSGDSFTVNRLVQTNPAANSTAKVVSEKSILEVNTNFDQGIIKGTERTVNHNGSGTVSQLHGTFNMINNVSDGTVTDGTGVYATSRNSGSGTLTTAVGGRHFGQNIGSGDINTAYGAFSRAQNNSDGTINTAIGAMGVAQNEGSGTIASARGFSALLNNTGSGTITDGYGIYISKQGAGPVTNYYGVHVGDMGVNANYYAVYTAGSTKSHFGGNVGMGTTTPGASLEVRGTGIRATQICDEDGNNCKDISSGWSAASGDFMADGSVPMTGELETASIRGGTGAGDNLTLKSSTNATKGKILFGNSGYDEVNNRLGLGTNSPSYKFHVYEYISSAVATSYYGVYKNQVAGTTVSDLATFYGDMSHTASTGGSTNNLYLLYGKNNRMSHDGNGSLNTGWGTYSASTNVGTGTVSKSHGIEGSSGNFSSGSITDNIGVKADAVNNSTGTISNNYGIDSWSRIVNGTMTNAYGVRSNINATGGSVTNSYGFYADLDGAGVGGVTNYYGLYVADEGSAGSRYAVYTAGTTKSYFGGNVGIATTSPGSSLEVRGTGIRATQICDEDGNNCKDISTGWGAGGDLMADGSVPMTGNLDMGANSTRYKDGDTNYVNLRAPAAITTDFTLTLPDSAGDANQVLQTDGSGNLTWVDQTTDTNTTDHGAMTGLTDDDHTQYTMLAGRSGGQTQIGGTDSGDNLTLSSTSNATKGKILFGSSAYDEVNDRLGIGATSPVAKIATDQTLTDTGAGTSYGFFNNNTVNPAADSTHVFYGTFNQVATQGSSNLTTVMSGRNALENYNTGTSNSMWSGHSKLRNHNGGDINVGLGYQSTVENKSSGTITSAMGYQGVVRNQGGGTLTNGYGLHADVQNTSTGTVGGAYGVLADISNNGTGAVTTAYGFRSRLNGTGPITNYYGLHIDDEGVNANYYAVYTEGTTKSYFGGNVGMGTTTPGASLEVRGTGIRATQICDEDGNNCKDISSGWSAASGDFMADGSVPMTGELETASIRGGTGAGDNLTLKSSTNATKGKILFGNSGYDEVNNRLGLGTATPSYKFHLYEYITSAVATSYYAAYKNQVAAPTVSSSATFYGDMSQTASTGGSSNNLGFLYGKYNQMSHYGNGNLYQGWGSYNNSGNSGTGTITKSHGVEGSSGNFSTGNITDNIGVKAFAINNSTGAITNNYGIESWSQIGNGTMTNSYGVKSNIYATGGSVTNSYGFYADLDGAGVGGVTNYYGLYVADEGSVGSRYAVYTAGTTKSYFGGNVGIATTSPGSSLEVRGTGIRATQICDEDGNNCKDISTGWSGATGDFMANGSVPMSGNLQLGSNYLSSDGDNEGININSSGEVRMSSLLQVPVIRGSSQAGNNLTLRSTTDATKGKIFLGDNSVYDEVNTRLGVGDTTPDSTLDVNGTIRAVQLCDENGTNCQDLSSPAAAGDFMADGSVTMTGDLKVGTNDLGLNVANPLYQIHAYKSYSDTSGVTYGQFYQHNIAPSADGTANIRAQHIDVDLGSANNAGYVYGSYLDSSKLGAGNLTALEGYHAELANYSGSINTVKAMSASSLAQGASVVNNYGISAVARNYTSGGSTNSYGGHFQQVTWNTTNTNSYGTYSDVVNNSGSGQIFFAYGNYSTIRTYAGSGSISNAYGYYANLDNIGSTVNNYYGVYVADEGTTSTYYAIYTAGSTKSYFGGKVGMGVTAPARTLHVGGTEGMRLAASSLPGSPATGDIAVDSGDSNTLKWYDGSSWQSAGGSSGGWEEISTVDVASDTSGVTISSIPTNYKMLKIYFSLGTSVTSASEGRIRFNSDSGSNYAFLLTNDWPSDAGSSGTGAATYGYFTYVEGNTSGSPNTYYWTTGEAIINNISNQRKMMSSTSTSHKPGAHGGLYQTSVEWNNTSSTITSMYFHYSTGNIAAGSRIVVMGMK